VAQGRHPHLRLGLSAPRYFPAGYIPAGYIPAGYIPAGYFPAGYFPAGLPRPMVASSTSSPACPIAPGATGGDAPTVLVNAR